MSDDRRPDPDVLLARVQREEKKRRRGRLKIFFGAAAGVGKTFSMLLAARERKAEGEDVVVGIVETHGRAETAELLEGIESLPLRTVPHKSVTLREFDLDAALARKPALILVDELAHTDAPGSRHAKRWQDIEELREAGIDVYTSLNVQHLESLNDVVGQITGIRVWETVPDSVFEGADEVEVIDLPPDELLERLEEGKVYLPEQAERAIRSFFRKGNLIALRELSLRRTAARVDAQMRDYREDHAIAEPWPAAERVVLAIGPGPAAQQVVRAGARLALSLRAEWVGVYVETPRLQKLPEVERDRVLSTLRLAEQLGAETVTVGGGNVADEIVALARTRNASLIVIGHSRKETWRDWLRTSVADAIVRRATDIDVQMVPADTGRLADLPRSARPLLARSQSYLGLDERSGRGDKTRYPGYLWAAGIAALVTGGAALLHERIELSNLVMLYLLGVVVTAMRFGRGPAVLCSVLSVAAFDFFFVPPYWTFAVSDAEYLVTFSVMLVVGIVIGNLTAGLRLQARIAGYRERRVAALYQMSRALAATTDVEEMLRLAVKHLSEVFVCQAVVLLPGTDGKLQMPCGESISGSLHGADIAVAQWVYDYGQPAGVGTDTLSGAEAHYEPLEASGKRVGVLAILPANPRHLFVPEQQRLLETFATQVAASLERARLVDHARSAEVRVESERLRSSLLASISHDLRTPLAAIVGNASSLAEHSGRLDPQARRELAGAIVDEARRMTGLVSNVLDMARLEAGSVQMHLDWQSLEEVIGSVLARFDSVLENRPVRVALPADVPLVRIDGVMIAQVLANLIENAAKYTPPGSAIEISAETRPQELVVSVSDAGPGIPAGEEERIFRKFYRVRPRARKGVSASGSPSAAPSWRPTVEESRRRTGAAAGRASSSRCRSRAPLPRSPLSPSR